MPVAASLPASRACPIRGWHACAGVRTSGRSLAFAALAVLLFFAVPARAELVRFTNGRVLSVASCRFEGDVVVMEFWAGGEVRAPRSLVDEIMPDEVPRARAVALEALERSAVSSAAPSLGEIRAMIDRLAPKFGVPRDLAHAVVRVESNYEPTAISPKGAMGLMQLMPAVAAQYGVRDPFEPEANLSAGLRHLRGLLDRFGLAIGLAAYNAGEGAVNRYGGLPPYRETENYVRKIMALVR